MSQFRNKFFYGMMKVNIEEKVSMNKQQVLFIIRGIPGSGKSTFARKWVSEDPENRVRVNRDDLRFLMYGKYHGLTPKQENTVTAQEYSLVRGALAHRQSVIVDNQNLEESYIYPFLEIAKDHKAIVLHKDFNVDLEVAYENNKNRDRNVPEKAMLKTYRRYVKNGKFPPFPVLTIKNDEQYYPDDSLPPAILLDVDGTAMDMSPTRGPFDFSKVLEDTPNVPVIKTVQALSAAGYKVVVLSGRDDSCVEDTMLQLEVAGVEVHEIYMRKTGDRRKDSIVKKEIFNNHIRHRFNILLALDDRNAVVDTYRKDLSLPVFQVNYGNF